MEGHNPIFYLHGIIDDVFMKHPDSDFVDIYYNNKELRIHNPRAINENIPNNIKIEDHNRYMKGLNDKFK